MSMSLRASAGRITACWPWTRWPRLSFVLTATVILSRRIAASAAGQSGTALTKLPPSPMKTLARPSIIACDRVYDIMSMCARRFETKHLLQLIEQFRLWLFVDTHRAITLHIGVTAHRADPRPRLADIAAQQQQVHSLLYIRSAKPMLRDPHAVADNNGLPPHVDVRYTLQLVAQQTADAQYVFPTRVAEIIGEDLEAVGVPRDELDIEYWFAAGLKRRVMRLQHQLHDSFECRDIAADADLAIFAGDSGLAKRRHFQRILGCRKPLECAFAQWVEYDDRYPPTRRVVQLSQHSRAVGAGLLPNDEDRV